MTDTGKVDRSLLFPGLLLFHQHYDRRRDHHRQNSQNPEQHHRDPAFLLSRLRLRLCGSLRRRRGLRLSLCLCRSLLRRGLLRRLKGHGHLRRGVVLPEGNPHGPDAAVAGLILGDDGDLHRLAVRPYVLKNLSPRNIVQEIALSVGEAGQGEHFLQILLVPFRGTAHGIDRYADSLDLFVQLVIRISQRLVINAVGYDDYSGIFYVLVFTDVIHDRVHDIGKIGVLILKLKSVNLRLDLQVIAAVLDQIGKVLRKCGDSEGISVPPGSRQIREKRLDTLSVFLVDGQGIVQHHNGSHRPPVFLLKLLCLIIAQVDVIDLPPLVFHE